MNHTLTTLPNGLRVVTVPLHDTQAVTVFVFTQVGSRYETRAMNGASHFIEHLMFKGTTRRPSAQDITKALDGVGASYNAATAKDWTGYFVKINHEHTELALDIVSDILRNSVFDPAEIERERGVIVEEIKMYEENPVMAIDDLFESAIFGDHHPLGWNITGSRTSVKKMTRTKLMQYRQRYYHAGNMMVIVTGKMDAGTPRLIAKYFRDVPRRRRAPAYRPYRVQPQPAVVRKYQELEQAQVALGMRAYAYTDRRLPALQVLSVILGGNMSSRLFLEVREKRGLAYNIGTSVNPYEDTGSFMIQVALEKGKIDEALRVVVDQLRKLKTTRVGPAELRRAKEYIRGKTILAIEDSESLASWYGRQALFARRIEPPSVTLAKIARVTADDVRRVAGHLFRPGLIRMAVVGPYKNETSWRAAIRQL